MKYLIVTITVIMALIQVKAQEMIQPATVQPIASGSFITFKKLVTKQNYRTLGFEKASEIKDAYMGDPIQVFMVRLDILQEYESGDNPNGLLSDCESIIYPVLVNGQVRSSIELEKLDGIWKPSQFGGENLAGILTMIRTKVSDNTKTDIASFFSVEVPALNQYFIAYNSNDVLMLVPIIDDPGFGFISGIPLPADKVFELLLPAAKAHDGLPG